MRHTTNRRCALFFGFVVTFDTDFKPRSAGIFDELEVNNLILYIISILRRPGPTSVGELLHRSSTSPKMCVLRLPCLSTFSFGPRM